MEAPKPVTKARDVVCQGCGGLGGRHKDPKCPFIRFRAVVRATSKRRGRRW